MNLRHLASVAVATTGLAATLVSIAPSAQAAAALQLEDDQISIVSDDRQSSVTATARIVLDDGSIGVWIDGTVSLGNGAAGCATVYAAYQTPFGHATWGGFTSWYDTSDLGRVCQGSATNAFHATLPGDVVRYRVILKRAPGGTTASTSTMQEHYVGDAPDSWGTVSRLDRDATPVRVATRGTTEHVAFEGGVTDYRLSAHGGYFSLSGYYQPQVASVISRVQGDLVWQVSLGSTAYLRVSWTYADGSVRVRDIGRVGEAAPRLHVDVESPDLALEGSSLDVVSTSISVLSGSTTKAWAPYSAFLDPQGAIS